MLITQVLSVLITAGLNGWNGRGLIGSSNLDPEDCAHCNARLSLADQTKIDAMFDELPPGPNIHDDVNRYDAILEERRYVYTQRCHCSWEHQRE